MNEEGNRVKDYNLCATNHDALNYITQRAKELSIALPSDTGRYAFWLDDVNDKMYCCEHCQELSKSDQAMLVYNAMIKELNKSIRRQNKAFLHTMI